MVFIFKRRGQVQKMAEGRGVVRRKCTVYGDTCQLGVYGLDFLTAKDEACGPDRDDPYVREHLILPCLKSDRENFVDLISSTSAAVWENFKNRD